MLLQVILALVNNYLEYGVDVSIALVKENIYNQLCTFNCPVFSTTKIMKRQLSKLEAVYSKAGEPRSGDTNFEYIERFEKDAVMLSCQGSRVIVVLGSITVTDLELASACDFINDLINDNENVYFITHYS